MIDTTGKFFSLGKASMYLQSTEHLRPRIIIHDGMDKMGKIGGKIGKILNNYYIPSCDK